MTIRLLSTFCLTCLLASCNASGQKAASFQSLSVPKDNLPSMRHVNEMNLSGDTLWFVYETEDGFGQRFLRNAIVDIHDNTLKVSSEIGKHVDGNYTSYMPYPFLCENGRLKVISQDDCEIYSIENGTALSRSNHYLVNVSSSMPFPISQYVQDVYETSPDNYVFIGREPMGGAQYAMKANLIANQIDTIKVIAASPDLKPWMPNAGELAYSKERNRLAFAYRLYPIVEIFTTDGDMVRLVRLGDDTFNPSTIEEADFDELNPLHTVDITSTSEYIYALYWNFKYSEADTSSPTIFKIDWDGKIVERYVNIPSLLYKIAAGKDYLIGWTGREFVRINL